MRGEDKTYRRKPEELKSNDSIVAKVKSLRPSEDAKYKFVTVIKIKRIVIYL